ncbi:hypothetical protein [Caulobacter sp. LjRoot300]|uniref:hypothetical protein n=1 Tax=Caulobacter sp. LjRoot300 TaxID=3342321 RepID=UPI003ECC5888
MMPAARVVLGMVASALCGALVVVLTGYFVDLAMTSPAFGRAVADSFESPGWAIIAALIWSSAAFAGVFIGALPALLITRSRKWPEAKRLATVVLSGGVAAAAAISPTLSLSLAAGALVTATIMSCIFWLVAGR